MQKNYLIIFMLLFISACGSTSDNTSLDENKDNIHQDNENNGKFSKLNGLITFDENDNTYNEPIRYRTGIMSFKITNGKESTANKITSGYLPYRHTKGSISLTEGCGAGLNQVSIIDSDGFKTAITPCIEDMYYSSKISPDASKIAVCIRHNTYKNGYFRNTMRTVIYDIKNGTKIAQYPNFGSIDWLPDGRLAISSLKTNDGIYITNKSLQQANKIDTKKPISFANNIDVSPSGKEILFEFNQQIWIMNIDGTEVRALIYGARKLIYPTWSPNENYIAYLATNQYNYTERTIFFYDIKKKTYFYFNLEDKIFTSSPTGYADIAGPLSWID